MARAKICIDSIDQIVSVHMEYEATVKEAGLLLFKYYTSLDTINDLLTIGAFRKLYPTASSTRNGDNVYNRINPNVYTKKENYHLDDYFLYMNTGSARVYIKDRSSYLYRWNINRWEYLHIDTNFMFVPLTPELVGI